MIASWASAPFEDRIGRFVTARAPAPTIGLVSMCSHMSRPTPPPGAVDGPSLGTTSRRRRARHSRANRARAHVVEEDSGRERYERQEEGVASDLNLDSLASVCLQWSRCRFHSFPASSSCRGLVVAEARTSQRQNVRARPKRLDLGAPDQVRACRHQSRKQHLASRCGASCQRT